MAPSTWRTILLALCGAGMLLVCIAVADQIGMGGSPAWYGVWGGYFDGSARAYHMTFRGVDPGGPADRAGLREGDLIDVRGHTRVDRLSMMGQPQAGRGYVFRVERGSAWSRAVVVPGPLYLSRFWNYVLWELTNFWLLGFAALIAWRRPYVENNLLLATVLAFAAIGFAGQPIFLGLPWAWPYVVLGIVDQALPLSIALWATLASGFGRPLTIARRSALGLCYASTVIATVCGDGTPDRTVGIAPLIATLTLWFDPTRFLGPLWTLPIDASVLAGLACSVLAILSARGVERRRAVWVLVPLTTFFTVLESTTLGFHFLSYALLLVMGQAYSLVAIVTPLVLTYAALNRRLIDVGFVLNRTVVFAIISTIVIGVFILVEWAAGEWFVNASHTTSVIAGMIVALVLGLSLRYIHTYVDRFVDTVLFRKRHDDESALRRFAHESAYISDPHILLERVVETVREHTTAEYADVFIRRGSSTFVSASKGRRAGIDENDPAIVALYAWSKPVQLHGISGSRLSGELAFPMISRGRMLGVLVCGPKRDDETYAPDESDALLAIAHGVGGALDVLETKGARGGDAALAELCESVRVLSEATRSLPDAIAERLRGGIERI